VITESILTDDDLDPEGEALDPLPALVDQRRHGLAVQEIEVGVVAGSYARFLPSHIDDLAFFEPDSEHTIGGWVSPYEELGRELLRLVEAFRFADKTNRQSAKTALHSFLQAIQAKLSRRRPPEGPPLRVLGGLLAEARGLFGICFGALREFEISDSTRRVLGAQHVPAGQALSWSARLALPVFSRKELSAMWRVAREDPREAITPPPTARKLAVWLLAHRLQMHAPFLARKLLGNAAVRDFRRVPNPIDGAVSY
jgi:hypothetical protein